MVPGESVPDRRKSTCKGPVQRMARRPVWLEWNNGQGGEEEKMSSER